MSNMPDTTSRWFLKLKPNPLARLRLFCLPYAGGSALIYRQWPQQLPSSVEVCPVQLAGRGSRMKEPFITHSSVIVEQLAVAMRPLLDKPFALFGHSMGALICFELARHLRREGMTAPVHLFVSGRRAPQLPVRETPRYSLSDEDLTEHLRHLQGTPQELLEDPELMQLMLPLVRADFEINENYNYTVEPPLDCPMSAYGGLQDSEVTRDDLEAWREHTNAAFNMRMFDGSHFFLHKSESLLLHSLARDLHRHLGEAA